MSGSYTSKNNKSGCTLAMSFFPAEVTINYVITDVEKKRKFVCVDTNDIPEIAVVDPEMMATMPKGLTAATGRDALTHAIEGYRDVYKRQACVRPRLPRPRPHRARRLQRPWPRRKSPCPP